MTGTTEVFARCAAAGRAALIAYLPVGYPDLPTSLAAMTALVEEGADIVEIGLPYTDPLMDGPVIQAAADQALQAGTRVADGFSAVSAVSQAGAVPLVMSYWNLILHRGVSRYAAELAAAGGGGLITPDLIPDEAGEWLHASDEHDLDRIFLVAPSSTPQRLALVTRHCRGFVYAASTMGVTGARGTLDGAAEALVARTKAVTDTPVAVGLGVSTGEQAAKVAAFADGVIVGSALVAALREDVGERRELDAGFPTLRALTRELARGVKEGRR